MEGKSSVERVIGTRMRTTFLIETSLLTMRVKGEQSSNMADQEDW